MRDMLKRVLIGSAALIVLLGVFLWTKIYIYPKPRIDAATGQLAPGFSLRDAEGNLFQLSAQRGHRTVLYFYRGYW